MTRVLGIVGWAAVLATGCVLIAGGLWRGSGTAMVAGIAAIVALHAWR